MNKWRNVSVSFTVELGLARKGEEVSEGRWIDLTYGKNLPPSALEEITRFIPASCKGVELDFDARSSGYYDPGQSYGDPGNCYPPEYEDERTVKEVDLLLDGKKRLPLSKESTNLLALLYEDEIQMVDIPEHDYCGPEWEDD